MAGTCYLPNGTTVKASQAACNAGGGQFVPDTQQSTAPADDRNFAQRYLQDRSMGNKLLDASTFIPGIGLGGLALKGAFTGLKNSKRIGDLMKGGANLFKTSKPQRYADNAANRAANRVGDKIPLTTRGPNIPAAKPTYDPIKKTWSKPKPTRSQVPKLDKRGNPIYAQGPQRLSPLKVGGAASLAGGMGAGSMLNSGTIPNQEFNDRKNQESSLIASQIAGFTDQENAATQKAAQAKSEADRIAGLNPMERMMENLKTPGFLNESMSGAKGDTRLNRLGQLMSYYGSTPKQRATMKNPMDRFAAIEKGVMDNETALARAQATLKSQYGKPTVNNLADGMFDLVKDAYGGTWLPFDDKSDDELKRISSLAAVRLTEISQDPAYMGIGEEQLRVEAVRQVGEELGL